MKKLNLLFLEIIIGLLFISGCSSSVKNTDVNVINGKWLLQSINDKEIVKEQAGKQIPFLQFNSNGQVGGNTGCNDLSGKEVKREIILHSAICR